MALTIASRRRPTVAERTSPPRRGRCTMDDLEIHLEDSPGQLARLGETLGCAGVSVEGGGLFVVEGRAVAHFLFADGNAARAALESAGMRVASCREVLSVRLRQDQPGQLGR